MGFSNIRFPIDVRAPSGTWGVHCDNDDELRNAVKVHASASPGFISMCDRGELLDVLEAAVRRKDRLSHPKMASSQEDPR